MEHIIPTIEGYDENDFDDDDDDDDHDVNEKTRHQVDDDDSDDDEDVDQFYYKTPGKGNIGNGVGHANGGMRGHIANGGTQFESSLLKYVLPMKNHLSPGTPNFDSVSQTASFVSG